MIELKRLPDWRARMTAAIDVVKYRSFDWRQCDCVSGLAAPLVAARLTAQAALAQPASLGAHFRADGVPDLAPARTFITLPASSPPRLAAE